MSLNKIEYLVEIETPIYPTEDVDKLIKCLNELFPYAQWKDGTDKIFGESKSLERFRKILKDMKIRDTARTQLENSINGDECSITLSKQASCNRKINFTDEDQALGVIKVTIKSNNINDMVDALTRIEDVE